MVVKFAKALGAKCTVISTTPSKRKEALGKLGADDFVLSTDMNAMKEREGTLDFIIDTVSVPKDLDFFMQLLRVDGLLVTVGLPSEGLCIEVKLSPIIQTQKLLFYFSVIHSSDSSVDLFCCSFCSIFVFF